MKSIDVFIAYSRKDKRIANQLLERLKPLERQDSSFLLHADKFLLDSEQEIHTKQACIILLLISEHFLTSSYFQTIAEKTWEASKRGKEDNVRVIPLIVRPSNWRGTLFDTLMLLLTNRKSNAAANDPETVFLTLTQGMQKVAEELTEDTPPPSASALSSTTKIKESGESAEKRKMLQDIEKRLYNFHGFKRGYEHLFFSSYSPKEKQELEAEIQHYEEAIRKLLIEYIKLANQISATIPDDILHIAPLLENMEGRKSRPKIGDFL